MRKTIQKILLWFKNSFAGSTHLAEIPVLGTLRRFVFALMKTDQVVVHGHRMYLDPLDSLCLSAKGVYEPFESDLILHEVRPGDVALDLGANIGYFTLMMARLVGPAGRIYAFEPDPENFTLLRKNIESNGYVNVELINKAVSNETGEKKLFLSEDNRGDHRLYDSADGRQSRAVSTIRLDDFFHQTPGKIDFIKMDIQGAEFWALSGAPELLQRNPNVVLITEFWPVGLHRAGVDPRKYLDLVSGLGFSTFEVIENERKIKNSSPDRLLSQYAPATERFTTLLCTRQRSLSAFTQSFFKN
jgi:FkbM family methyltransferase